MREDDRDNEQTQARRDDSRGSANQPLRAPSSIERLEGQATSQIGAGAGKTPSPRIIEANDEAVPKVIRGTEAFSLAQQELEAIDQITHGLTTLVTARMERLRNGESQ